MTETITESRGEGDEWVPVSVSSRFIPPRLPDVLAGGASGVVGSGGEIDVDGLDGTPLEIPAAGELSVGTEVTVRKRGSDLYCRSQKREEAAREEQRRRHKLAEKATERAKHRARRRAEAFWDLYEVPFEYEVAIKGRRSELQRGSTGTGATDQTVIHLYALEGFTDGRLSREARSYVCRDEGKYRMSEVRHEDGDGDQYLPAITCETCRKRMERWKTTDNPETP